MRDINFDDWLKVMNFWLDYGRSKGWDIYNEKRFSEGDGFMVLNGFHKSDMFDFTAWFSEKEE